MKNLHQHQHLQQAGMNQQHSLSQQNMPQATVLNQQHQQQQQQTLMQQHHQQILNQQHLAMNNLQQDMKSRSVSRLPGIK